LSDEPQLRGYRVRLRIVEEHDVALLASRPMMRRRERKRTFAEATGSKIFKTAGRRRESLSKRWLSSRTQNSSSRPLRPSRNSALVRGIVSACRFLQRVKAAVATLG
jgi:hypothetical protein